MDFRTDQTDDCEMCGGSSIGLEADNIQECHFSDVSKPKIMSLGFREDHNLLLESEN